MMCLGISPELPLGGGQWLPAKGAALIHDETDKIFGKCHIYVVRRAVGVPGEGLTDTAACMKVRPYWNENGPAMAGLFHFLTVKPRICLI